MRPFSDNFVLTKTLFYILSRFFRSRTIIAQIVIWLAIAIAGVSGLSGRTCPSHSNLSEDISSETLSIPVPGSHFPAVLHVNLIAILDNLTQTCWNSSCYVGVSTWTVSQHLLTSISNSNGFDQSSACVQFQFWESVLANCNQSKIADNVLTTLTLSMDTLVLRSALYSRNIHVTLSTLPFFLLNRTRDSFPIPVPVIQRCDDWTMSISDLDLLYQRFNTCQAIYNHSERLSPGLCYVYSITPYSAECIPDVYSHLKAEHARCTGVCKYGDECNPLYVCYSLTVSKVKLYTFLETSYSVECYLSCINRSIYMLSLLKVVTRPIPCACDGIYEIVLNQNHHISPLRRWEEESLHF